MKRLLSIRYSEWGFNLAMLVLRLAAGGFMLPYGYDKLVSFAQNSGKFMNFMGIGSTASYTLLVFAEFFCSIFIILGLFTRLALIPLIIAMSVAFFKGENADLFGKGEHAATFLASYLVLMLCGPGKVSVDGMINK
ncbi:MAG: DoxX family protein [Gemmatimonadaceae bacterium]|nr:DoxX family protein [Chitinophagaceae bacterium]